MYRTGKRKEKVRRGDRPDSERYASGRQRPPTPVYEGGKRKRGTEGGGSARTGKGLEEDLPAPEIIRRYRTGRS